MIHPTALVGEEALLGNEVSIGPYAVVEDGARVGDRTRLAAHAIVRSGTSLGADCAVDSFAVLGGDPNHTEFDPDADTRLEIGARCVIRESVTAHRAFAEGAATRLGDGCFLMAGSHVAHDCEIGDGVILANGALLGGHVSVGDDSFLGGHAAVHQYVRTGCGVMIGGHARVTKDVAPYLLLGERDEVRGLNLVGLRRRGTPAETIRELKELYHALLRSPGNPVDAAARLPLPGSAEARRFLEFFIPSKRGYAKNVLS